MAFSIEKEFKAIKEYRVVGHPGFWVVEANIHNNWAAVNKFGYYDDEYYWYDTKKDALIAKEKFEQFEIVQ